MLILAAILAIFVYGLIAAMLGTLLPELSTRFALTPGQNGDIALAQAIGLIIASVAVGPLIDIKGKKTGLLLGLGLIAISLFVVPSAPAAGLGPVFLALGVGGGIIVTAANALVSDISESRRASTLNLLNLFFGLGGLVTPLIGGSILEGNTIALCYLVAVLTVLTFVLHVATPMPRPTGERGFKMSEVGPVLGRPVLFLLALLLFLYVTCEVGVWNWLPRHLVALGIPQSRALKILSLGFALGLLVGRVAVSRILIRVSSPVVTLGASILMAVTTYAMLQTRDAFLAGVLVFCAGLAMAPVFPTTLAMVGDAFPRMTATAMGVVITCGWIGLAISSRIIGAIAGNDASQLKTALLVIPIASVLMVFVTLAVRPMLARKV
ncbi:MAG TPA: MFS transporter [Bryobacteraceae bacterium]|jgi:fucose permease|nr:MFS transporter [Bryobacteraceae bacterium]